MSQCDKFPCYLQSPLINSFHALTRSHTAPSTLLCSTFCQPASADSFSLQHAISWCQSCSKLDHAAKNIYAAPFNIFFLFEHVCDCVPHNFPPHAIRDGISVRGESFRDELWLFVQRKKKSRHTDWGGMVGGLRLKEQWIFYFCH